jgi:RNA polymerase sigma-70 factor (ECF subfamily)
MMAVRKAAEKTLPTEVDERLLVEAAQKDPARFADLYEIHFERVYAYIVRRVRDRDTAEDLVSEVFHKALENLPRYEWRGVPFSAWLFRIAGNAITDRSKRGAREQLSFEEPPDSMAEATLEETEDRARLFFLVNRLPADQRRVIVQRFVEQRSIREIAEQLGRSQGAIKQLQFRALEKLRAQMEGAHA